MEESYNKIYYCDFNLYALVYSLSNFATSWFKSCQVRAGLEFLWFRGGQTGEWIWKNFKVGDVLFFREILVFELDSRLLCIAHAQQQHHAKRKSPTQLDFNEDWTPQSAIRKPAESLLYMPGVVNNNPEIRSTIKLK